jgi:hypothetical protein
VDKDTVSRPTLTFTFESKRHVRRVLVLAAVAACGRPSGVRPGFSDQVPATHTVCEGVRARGIEHVGLALVPIQLRAGRRGPRATRRPRAGHPRSWLQLEEAMSRLEPQLHQCWIWASAHNAPEVTADISFTVTPFGALEAFSIATPDFRAPELVACLQETLGNVSLADASPRTTRMHARVAFQRVDEGPWLVMPRRPSKRAPVAHPHLCIPVVDDTKPDIVESPLVYTTDDRGPRDEPRRPFTEPACIRRHRPDDTVIVRAYEANRGAFEACYADAYERHIDAQIRAQHRGELLAGTVELDVQFVGIADPVVTAVRGAGDDTLHACLRAAMKDVFLVDVPSDFAIDATFQLELDPTKWPVEVPDLAARERALVHARGDLARCQARADLLLALAAQRPWLDDARILDETRALTEAAAALPRPEACIERVDALLEQIAGGLHMDGAQLRWSQLARIETALPIADHVAWGFALRWYHAATIAMTPERNAEGVGILRAQAADDDLSTSVAASELARYDQPHVLTPPRDCDQQR